jgi:hypothetical protein
MKTEDLRNLTDAERNLAFFREWRLKSNVERTAKQLVESAEWLARDLEDLARKVKTLDTSKLQTAEHLTVNSLARCRAVGQRRPPVRQLMQAWRCCEFDG